MCKFLKTGATDPMGPWGPSGQQQPLGPLGL